MTHNTYTFLLPAYKILYFEESLRSILSQTYPHFQVVVSDDASPEPLKDIVDSFGDPRVHYCRNRTNLGACKLAHHWNLLLNDCHSDFTIVASDDDCYHSGFLEVMDSLINRFPDIDLFRARVSLIDEASNLLHSESTREFVLTSGDFLGHFFDNDAIHCIGNYIFRTTSLKKQGGFVEFPLAWKSDTATQLLMSKRGVVFSENPLFSFRMSGHNISSRCEKDKIKDSEKMKAVLLFHQWLYEHIFISPDIIEDTEILRLFNKKLEGEIRSYYWTLSFSDFISLFMKLRNEGWFVDWRSRLSFLLYWFRSLK